MICAHPACDAEGTNSVNGVGLCETHAEEVFPIRGEDPSFGPAKNQAHEIPAWFSEVG